MAVSIPLPSTPEEGGGALLAGPSSSYSPTHSLSSTTSISSVMSDDSKMIKELREMLAHSMAAREKVEASKMVSVCFSPSSRCVPVYTYTCTCNSPGTLLCDRKCTYIQSRIMREKNTELPLRRGFALQIPVWCTCAHSRIISCVFTEPVRES